MMKLIALLALLVACGSAETDLRVDTMLPPDEPEVAACSDTCSSATPVVEPEVVDEEMIAQAMQPEPLTMYVRVVETGDPEKDSDLLELTLRVIDRVHQRTGAQIEIREDGFPIRYNDADKAQGRAVSDKWCFGGGCTAEHVHISIRSDTVARMYFDNFADNALAHEFAHVLSGWGQCTDIDVDGHLEPGHIVSNGNTGYGQMDWTAQDTELTCSCGACP
jgi:hypothetical protein